ncbi:FAD dependent oxidoreductase [Planctomycetes bacterium CA13]|uniref:FAD dependent oxidoreductase n=1 Tax=Novipirellula herctigrandis TaxID=2527986 RepID=A0A5C5ZBT4_9BACT|nr:FAD dependent oxidoreductase [Planctomycetes bacterium CA13]
MKYLILSVLFSVLTAGPSWAAEQVPAHDVVIYGGTSAAVMAAVQCHRMGKSVVIVAPDKHLGGLSSGGLGFTDIGNRLTVGGLAREFYEKVYQHYDKPEAWAQETPRAFHQKNIGWRKMWDGENTRWVFEPHVAEAIFDQFISENNIPLFKDEWLDREHGVEKDAGRIQSITTLSGKVFKGKVFIDATYEGDLMAAAGVRYHVGREANSVYGEKWNGVQQGVFHHKHHFQGLKISPYKVKEDPTSGVLARISTEALEPNGTGDDKVQAYCFRMCLTNDPDNRIAFPKPRNYAPGQYELLLRIFEVMDPMYVFQKFDPVPNNKTDTNNHGPFSFDNLGMNWDYPEASYERRMEIIEEHKNYQLGMLFFLSHDPRVPRQLQEAMRKWGLPKDEFVDNGNWSHQLYVREARRMVGQYVITEHDLLGDLKSKTQKSIGMGSYGIDSHNIQRFVDSDGYVQNEGDVGVHVGDYRIPYDVIVPKEAEVSNLIVPVAASCSHVAYGSIRMEPVFMILAQSGATAACIAMDDETSVQSVDYNKLRTKLLADKQILEKSQRVPDPRKKN